MSKNHNNNIYDVLNISTDDNDQNNASSDVNDKDDKVTVSRDNDVTKSLNNNSIFIAVKQFYLQNQKQFKVAHINVNSIRHKFEPFREVLNENIFDVLAIQETKIDDSFPDNQFNVNMYVLHRQDYKSNEGGIMMYVRNDIPQFRRPDIEQLSFSNANGRIEILCVECSIKREKWLFISIYKQPKVKVDVVIECVDSIMMQYAKGNYNVMILGDLNVNMFNKKNALADCLDVHGLKNLVKDATCVKGKPSLIDLIITNKPKRFVNTVSVDTELSDFHNLVCTSTKFHIAPLRATTFTYRSYKHFDVNSFVDDISRIPYHIIDIFDDIDDSYWLWNELTMQVINVHAPIKTRTIKGNRVPYMNGELRKAINVRNMLKRKYDRCKNTLNWKKYRSQRNVVSKLRKKSMNVYLRNKCCDTPANGKAFWDAVKPLISPKSINKNDNIILLQDDNVVTQQNVVVTNFIEYFTNMAMHIGPDDSVNDNDDVMSCILKHEGHDSIQNIHKQMETAQSRDDFCFHNINVDIVRSHLQKLNCKKATGYDLLPSKILKVGSDVMCYSICKLMNMSINVCKYPNALKYAEICPVFKKGSKLDVTNYRPVSILPSMSKIFEREIVNQLTSYFNTIFSPLLSGFRQKHSCETVLLRMIENIKMSLDEGKVVCMLLMDLSRAFDCIPYKLFISKLRAYGCSPDACNYILSYYCKRKQRVKIGNSKSEWQYVNKGSAQGSLIGPLSYNIFSNDLLDVVDDDVDIYNYADDNSLVYAGYDYDLVKSKLLHNVQKVTSWFENNHMKVNQDKFQCIVFGKSGNLGTFRVGNYDIVPDDNVKILGLNVDNKLHFSSTYLTIMSKGWKTGASSI